MEKQELLNNIEGVFNDHISIGDNVKVTIEIKDNTNNDETTIDYDVDIEKEIK